MNHYPRHIGDYLKDTSHLSLLEHGIYTRLLDVYYTREGPIPADQVERLIGARTKDEKAALQAVLAEFFTLSPEGWRQARADRELARYQEKAERNRQVGKLGGRPRTQKEPRNNPDGFQNETQNEPTDNPSHKPIANNQEKATTSRSALNGAFSAFWEAYPRKKSKGQAEKAWIKLRPSEQLAERILASVERAKTSADWLREGGQFVPYPATWLNAKGWEDELPQDRPAAERRVAI